MTSTGPRRASSRTPLKALRDQARPEEARLAAVEGEEVARVFAAHPLRDLLTLEGPYPFFVDRERALFSSWYEFFPRSEGARVDPKTGKVVSGTFRTAAKRLQAVADMGFDVIYLPPIHPIGEVNRKGSNNTLTPTPDDVGSPWAIGSKDGGHDAVHPDLGTLKDFDAFVKQARKVGLEVALDFALQAAPDHPWATEHPEWFTTRADGTIAYAENPPKKYQDIYPINFDNDPEGIYAETERLLRHWMSHGVRIFRVDNPHTKPVAFWEWLLGAHPRDRPRRAVPLRGVHQAADDAGAGDGRLPPELHLLHLAHDAHRARDLPRRGVPRDLGGCCARTSSSTPPTSCTPTSSTAGRRRSRSAPPWPRPARRAGACTPASSSTSTWPSSRAARSTSTPRSTRSGSATGTAPTRAGATLAPYLTRLNEIRRAHPALQQLRNVTVHTSDDDAMLVFSKSESTEAGDDQVIVVVNLDPHHARTTTVHLNMPALGMGWEDTFTVHDEITGQDWQWGAHDYVHLDPCVEPAHILSVRRTA